MLRVTVRMFVGGLAAVIYTDAVQTVVMTIGSIALTIISMYL